MVRYQYAKDVLPPAPFVHVELQNPFSDLAVSDLPALLDSGADRTVVPAKLARDLQLTAIRDIVVGGLGGAQHSLQTFRVLLQIRHNEPTRLEVIAHEGEPFILLGRDVLNQFRIVLDGPNQMLEIG